MSSMSARPCTSCPANTDMDGTVTAAVSPLLCLPVDGYSGVIWFPADCDSVSLRNCASFDCHTVCKALSAKTKCVERAFKDVTTSSFQTAIKVSGQSCGVLKHRPEYKYSPYMYTTAADANPAFFNYCYIGNRGSCRAKPGISGREQRVCPCLTDVEAGEL
jgi:hypothetical protein